MAGHLRSTRETPAPRVRGWTPGAADRAERRVRSAAQEPARAAGDPGDAARPATAARVRGPRHGHRRAARAGARARPRGRRPAARRRRSGRARGPVCRSPRGGHRLTAGGVWPAGARGARPRSAGRLLGPARPARGRRRQRALRRSARSRLGRTGSGAGARRRPGGPSQTAGLERARSFTWRAAAERTAAIYEAARGRQLS